MHITHPQFGDNINAAEMIIELMNELPALSPLETQFVLNDAYDKKYGIYNHFGLKNKPLSSVGMYSAEYNGYNSQLYQLMFKYREAKIKDHFGVSVQEFLAQPREQIEWMFQIAEHFNKEEGKRNSEVLSELKSSLGDK